MRLLGLLELFEVEVDGFMLLVVDVDGGRGEEDMHEREERTGGG